MSDSSSKIPVLILSDHLGHEEGRTHGATSYFLSVLPRLDPARFEINVCFLRDPHPAVHHLEEKGIHPLFLGRGKYDPRVVPDIIRIIRDRHIRVVHAAGLKGMLAGAHAARHCGIPHLLHLHDMLPPPALLTALFRPCARRADAGIAISDAVRHFGISRLGFLPEKIHTLYNGIDLTPYAPTSPSQRAENKKSYGLSAQTKVLVSIGRMDPNKNQQQLLNVFSDIHQQLPDTHLFLAGSGPEESQLKSQAKSLNLTDHIHFLGHLDTVQPLLAMSDLMLMTPKKEGLGLSAIEALAAGVPVIAPRVGGLPEVIVEDQCGFLCDPADNKAFVNRALRLLSDTILYQTFSDAARKQASTFSLENHLQQLESLYQKWGIRS